MEYKGIFRGQKLLDAANSGAMITRSQSGKQAVQAIITTYGGVQPNELYYHIGNGKWKLYSLMSDKRRTGKLAETLEQRNASPHKYDWQDVDTKDPSVSYKKTAGKKVATPKKPVAKKASAGVPKPAPKAKDSGKDYAILENFKTRVLDKMDLFNCKNVKFEGKIADFDAGDGILYKSIKYNLTYEDGYPASDIGGNLDAMSRDYANGLLPVRVIFNREKFQRTISQPIMNYAINAWWQDHPNESLELAKKRGNRDAIDYQLNKAMVAAILGDKLSKGIINPKKLQEKASSVKNGSAPTGRKPEKKPLAGKTGSVTKTMSTVSKETDRIASSLLMSGDMQGSFDVFKKEKPNNTEVEYKKWLANKPEEKARHDKYIKAYKEHAPEYKGRVNKYVNEFKNAMHIDVKRSAVNNMAFAFEAAYRGLHPYANKQEVDSAFATFREKNGIVDVTKKSKPLEKVRAPGKQIGSQKIAVPKVDAKAVEVTKSTTGWNFKDQTHPDAMYFYGGLITNSEKYTKADRLKWLDMELERVKSNLKAERAVDTKTYGVQFANKNEQAIKMRKVNELLEKKKMIEAHVRAEKGLKTQNPNKILSITPLKQGITERTRNLPQGWLFKVQTNWFEATIAKDNTGKFYLVRNGHSDHGSFNSLGDAKKAILKMGMY